MAELKDAIRLAFEDSRGRYGHRRIHRVLISQGWRLAKKTVLKLMRELGLKCRVRRRRRYDSFQGEVGKIAANVLARDFVAAEPNQKWVTDVTEFRVGDRKAYLSPILDLFDRGIIAHSWSISPTVDFTNRSLATAIGCAAPDPGLVVHSDQGFQYQHRSWRALLDEIGATQSMSRKANCYDNAVMENFFGHMKSEMFHNTRFDSIEHLIAAGDEYIDWYNTTRISTKLKGLSPVQYRAQALAA